MGIQFEWDARKAGSNIAKHDVDFREAATIFGDPLSLTVSDPDHSVVEERYITIGNSFTSRLLVVAHADSGDRVRIISARAATRRERQAYENG